MGIYLQSYAKLSAKLGKEPHRAIVNSAKAWAKRRGIAEFFYASSEDDQTAARLSIYPPAGIVQFSIGPEHVDFGTKTSIAGPGYHLALVDLCDHLDRDLDLKWRWDVDGDSSGYAKTRSREDLYGAFLGQLRAQCDYWRDQDHYLCFVMNLEIGLGGDEPGKVSMPMGSIPVEEVAAIGSADDETATEFARDFYPWWFERIDRSFWEASLRAMLWTDAPWRKPDSAWEKHVYAAIATASKAIQNAPWRRLPSDLEKTINDLHDAMTFGKAPPKGEIGYRRRDRRFDLTGNWKLVAPGYYHETMEDDGGTVCIWHPEHEEIRATSWKLEKAAGSSRNWPGRLADQREQQSNDVAFRIDPSINSTQDGWGRFGRAECVVREGNTEHFLMLSLTSQLDGDAFRDRLSEIAEKTCFDTGPKVDKPGDA